MHAKFKLTTFIGRRVTPEQRRSEHFEKVLLFLPKLYAAHLAPKEWQGGDGQRPSMADEFMYPGTQYFDHAQEAFQNATRAEVHIYILEKDYERLAVEIAFYRGKEETGKGIVFTFDLSDGEIGAGYLRP